MYSDFHRVADGLDLIFIEEEPKLSIDKEYVFNFVNAGLLQPEELVEFVIKNKVSIQFLKLILS